MISFQYPCHPSMDPKKRTKFPNRFGQGKTRKSRCKECGKRWAFKLSPNGPIITPAD